MKKTISVFGLFLLFPALILAQYEQKFGIYVTAGSFKTFGNRYNEEYYAPQQMPNYGPGIYINAGIQTRFGEHFSLVAGFGIMATNTWTYKASGGDNWLYWTIDDPITGQVIEKGENYLDLRNYSIFAKPIYYFSPGQKWNPYFSAGININRTSAWFENNNWYAQKRLGLLAPDDTEPWNDNLEENFGIGFNPGFGVEYSPGEKLHFFLETGYYFIALNKNNFKDPQRVENFNAIVLQIGCRLNFIKSKEF